MGWNHRWTIVCKSGVQIVDKVGAANVGNYGIMGTVHYAVVVNGAAVVNDASIVRNGRVRIVGNGGESAVVVNSSAVVMNGVAAIVMKGGSVGDGAVINHANLT